MKSSFSEKYRLKVVEREPPFVPRRGKQKLSIRNKYT
jgi:hypothetical protein